MIELGRRRATRRWLPRLSPGLRRLVPTPRAAWRRRWLSTLVALWWTCYRRRPTCSSPRRPPLTWTPSRGPRRRLEHRTRHLSLQCKYLVLYSKFEALGLAPGKPGAARAGRKAHRLI